MQIGPIISSEAPPSDVPGQADVIKLESMAQLETLASPARLEVIDALDDHGPMTAGEIAWQLGRTAQSVYFHIKKLLDAGLIITAGRQPGNRRDSTVYAPMAKRMYFPGKLSSSAIAKMSRKIASSYLRMAIRDQAKAAEHALEIPPDHHQRVMLNRVTVWLTLDEADEIRDHLEALRAKTRDSRRSRDRQLYSVTYSLMPIPSTGKSDDSDLDDLEDE